MIKPLRSTHKSVFSGLACPGRTVTGLVEPASQVALAIPGEVEAGLAPYFRPGDPTDITLPKTVLASLLRPDI